MIIRLETDEWDKKNNVGVSIDNPSLEQIMEKIDKLDGINEDSISLFKSDDEFLAIGGGDQNKCVLSIVTSNKTLELSNGTSNSERVLVSVGGQDGEFPGYMLVDKALVKEAVIYYYKEGLPNPELEWKEWDGTC
ncbi:MAG TPA: hypothetical protein VIM29_07120 [Bacillota bacterium]